MNNKINPMPITVELYNTYTEHGVICCLSNWDVMYVPWYMYTEVLCICVRGYIPSYRHSAC